MSVSVGRFGSVFRQPFGSCVCRGARRNGRARAASSTATCCSAIAWCRTLPLRTRDHPRTVCSAAGATGPMPPGTSPLTRRSHPFGRDRRTGRGSVPLCTLFERRAASVHSAEQHRVTHRPDDTAHPLNPSRTSAHASRGTPASLLADPTSRTATGTALAPVRCRRALASPAPHRWPPSRRPVRRAVLERTPSRSPRPPGTFLLRATRGRRSPARKPRTRPRGDPSTRGRGREKAR